MGVLDDVRKWLNDVPLWKELGTIPDRTAALEKKVAALEEQLNGKYPADICLKCGSRSMRARSSFGPNAKGMMTQMWQCQDAACNFHEERLIKPK
ncbi:hypothetical protein JQ580_04645 [Bradyrhizobium japonicum]|uniref:ABC transporter C-terminal domain-containing protein n=1 Tax=Bradyrhizobium ottawaense TaxID=931866 RepID=UPI001BAD13D3|nr:ABC transporter C-terminal domain-containing protein [Bradyrhizobium ottawaense]MBR0990003.1 hypothetical protein [Bradyrhizobium japonicum]MBR1328832.1 hypothetical protein [Bradyrhizobium ottawaense]